MEPQLSSRGWDALRHLAREYSTVPLVSYLKTKPKFACLTRSRLHRMSKSTRGTWCSWFITFASHLGTQDSAKGVRFNSGCVHRNDPFFAFLAQTSPLRSPLLNVLFVTFVLGDSLRRRAFISPRAWDDLRLDLSTCVFLGIFAMSIQTVRLHSVLLSYRPMLLPPRY
jgi:hypothetical protein